MANPLVTVICLCYNHERFVSAAIESVVNQTYRELQIIVWDDGSSDSSPAVITELKLKYPQLLVTLSSNNQGNCRAFNQAFALAKGDFIIDFSTDDIMHEQRIAKQVDWLQHSDDQTGVVFTDATYITERGDLIRHHYEHLFRHGLINEITTGDVFQKVLTTYYIASPTMMMRRSVLDKLGGYDEQLTYEDFDLWVRSARLFKYTFLNERLTLIRKLTTAMSSGMYRAGDKQLLSTYHVCLKAVDLCRNEQDKNALAQRVRYEFRQSTMSENYQEANYFWELLQSLDSPRLEDKFWRMVFFMRIPLAGWRRLYHRLRYSN